MVLRPVAVFSCVFCALACEPGSQIGELHDGDAAGSVDARPVVDGDTADAGACACGPDTCGPRTCGRSPCGYPCGTCAFDEWCSGGTCEAGGGPGTRCSDAFDWYGWGNVWEGDVGLRVCPSDATMVEACTCSGGGPDAWINCSGSCFAPCVGSVDCAGVTCGPTEYCQGCSDGSTTTYACRPREGSDGSCPAASMVFDVFCDGDEDCASTDQCMAIVGDTVSVRCERDDTGHSCGAGPGFHELCDNVSDCSTCASCSPSTFADWVTPGHDLGICR